MTDPLDDIDEMDRIQLDFQAMELAMFPADPVVEMDNERVEDDVEADAEVEDLLTDAGLQVMDEDVTDLDDYEL